MSEIIGYGMFVLFWAGVVVITRQAAGFWLGIKIVLGAVVVTFWVVIAVVLMGGN